MEHHNNYIIAIDFSRRDILKKVTKITLPKNTRERMVSFFLKTSVPRMLNIK